MFSGRSPDIALSDELPRLLPEIAYGPVSALGAAYSCAPLPRGLRRSQRLRRRGPSPPELAGPRRGLTARAGRAVAARAGRAVAARAGRLALCSGGPRAHCSGAPWVKSLEPTAPLQAANGEAMKKLKRTLHLQSEVVRGCRGEGGAGGFRHAGRDAGDAKELCPGAPVRRLAGTRQQG